MHHSNFGVVGQESSPQSLTAYNLDRLAKCWETATNLIELVEKIDNSLGYNLGKTVKKNEIMDNVV